MKSATVSQSHFASFDWVLSQVNPLVAVSALAAVLALAASLLTSFVSRDSRRLAAERLAELECQQIASKEFEYRFQTSRALLDNLLVQAEETDCSLWALEQDVNTWSLSLKQ